MLHCIADMITSKVTFAALAAMAVALSLAVVPALTNQVFAQDFSGSNGQGHTRECDKANTDEEEEGPCPGNSQKSPNKCQVTFAGKSSNVKDDEEPPCAE
jgi:hypothetical protein